MIRNRLILLFIGTLLCYQAFCKILPLENSKLNYTNVYFEDNLVKEAVRYHFDLYSDSLLTQLLTSKTNTLPCFWKGDLTWGASYYWKITAVALDGKNISTGELHKFSIIKITYLTFDEVRVDVKINNEEKNAGGVISVDYTKSIIDRAGKPVWTIPELPGVPAGLMYIRDMRITKDNTVTFLTLDAPYELDFNGTILWKAPHPFVLKADTVNYHHDFKKTVRGTYMVLANKYVYRPLLGTYSPLELKNSPDVKLVDGTLCKKVLVTTLLEFDKTGALIWVWDANDYLDDEDLNFKKMELGTPNFATHANAFGESKDGTKIYLSFRDLSRIIKIDKQTKKVEWSYGELYPSGEARTKVNMMNQHDANPSDHKSIYIFNNNGLNNPKGISGVLEIKDNEQTNDSILWRFDMNFDTLTNGKSINGGNIVELPNKNLLICAGALNRIVEVTKSKEIVWDALFYLRGNHDTTWQPFSQYRANWSKQLNWYHFLTQIKPLAVKSEKIYAAEITINNTGNVEDSYDIEIVSAEGVIERAVITELVKPGEANKQTVRFKSKKSKTGLKILIKSKNSQQKDILYNCGS